MARNKTPKSVLEARNSKHAKGRADDAAAGVVPDPPEWLDAPAIQLWLRMIGKMPRALLAELDAEALARYCSLQIRFIELTKSLRESGETYISPASGALVNRPEVATLNQLAGHLAKLDSQFGLTPIARANLDHEPPKEDDPMLALMKERA